MDSAGYGEIKPFEISTEFEMGLYPPEHPLESCTAITRGLGETEPPEGEPSIIFTENGAEKSSLHLSSPNKKQGPPEKLPGSAGLELPKPTRGGSAHRNIQGKRLSNQTIMQRQRQQPASRGSKPPTGEARALLSS